MRAFPNDTDAVVYFTYSPLNDTSIVTKVHLSLVDQRTNENALNDITGVLIYDASSGQGDASSSVGFDPSTGMYYVVIPRISLRGTAAWNINQYYKVQLRLDCTDGGDYSDEKTKTAYLLENQLNFSEWSTVCLLRPILQPNIQLRQFDLNQSTFEPSYNKGIIPINGKVFFGDGGNNGETETLQSYTLQVLPRESNTVIYQTENIYTGNQIDPNDINYRLDLQAIDTDETHEFILRVIITTKNQYVMSKDYEFAIYDYTEMTDFHPVGVHDEDSTDTSLTVDVNEEEGIATFRFRNMAALYGIIYVKRASSVSNFKDWESILEKRVSDTVDITITDNTIGSHVWYRYSIQFENNMGALSQVYYTNIIFPKFYDAFISRLDRQLDVRYDFKVTSVKPVVNRAKIDTLGGKYPKFAENAVLNYKQFSITGLISAEADYHQVFMTKAGYFKDSYNNYRTFLSQEKILELVRNDSKDWIDQTGRYLTTTYDDWFWEREFREEAVTWLNDGEPKLFRSMTEGLVPVMITDISLTPKIQLGRRLYDFSATMYEIGDGHSLENLDALGIIDIPKVEIGLGSGDADTPGGNPGADYRVVETIGQVFEFSPTDNNNMITAGAIRDRVLEKYDAGGVYREREAFDLYIKNVQIYFHNDPHMFLMTGNNNLQMVTSATQQQIQSGRVRLGYTFQIQTSESAGWQTIFVNERGYYQIPEDMNVTGIAFNQYTDAATGREGDNVSINYIVVFKERAAAGTVIVGQTVDRTVIGQYQGVFKANQFLGDMIRSKYNYISGNITQRMQYWRGISIDVTPYAVAHIKYRSMDDYENYVVGATGILHMLRDFPISDMCFLGVSMTEQPIERQRYLAEHECCILNESADTTANIKKPLNNCVYNIDGKQMIYNQNTWVQYTSNGNGTGIAAVDVEGAINYFGDIVATQY